MTSIVWTNPWSDNIRQCLWAKEQGKCYFCCCACFLYADLQLHKYNTFSYIIILSILLSADIFDDWIFVFRWHSNVNNFLFARTHIPNWRIQQWIHKLFFSFFLSSHVYMLFVTKHLHVVMSWICLMCIHNECVCVCVCCSVHISALGRGKSTLQYQFSSVCRLILFFAHDYACATVTIIIC